MPADSHALESIGPYAGYQDHEIERIVEREAVQRLLGHADISTTGNIYTDWDVDQLAQTLAEIGDD